MNDAMRDPWKASAAGSSPAPHPALRALWALGGGPLAFVRADEQLAERLSRLVRDDVPAIVRDDGRAFGTLTAAIDLSHALQGDAGARSETAHAPNDANANATQRPHATPPSLLAELRESRPTDVRRSPSAPSVSLRGSMPLPSTPSKPKPAPGTSTSPATSPSTRATGAAPTPMPSVPPHWPQATAVTAGQMQATFATPFVMSALRAAEGALHTLPIPSPSAMTSMLAPYVGGTAPTAPPDAARSAIARLLQVTERVERKIAAARAAAGGLAADSRALTRRGTHESALGDSDALRSAMLPPPSALPSARPAAARAGTSSSLDAGSNSVMTPSFASPAPAAELRGFRGLAMRATEGQETDVERAPLLQTRFPARRGWELASSDEAWGLEAAARAEGVDLDEVAS